EPVDVDEVGRLAAGEAQEHGVRAGHGGDVGRHRSPRLPAAGVGDREAADRCVVHVVQPDLDQAAHAAGGAGGDPRGELVRGGRAEVDVVVAGPVTVGDEADVLPAAAVRRGLHLHPGLGVEALRLDGAVRVAPAGR